VSLFLPHLGRNGFQSGYLSKDGFFQCPVDVLAKLLQVIVPEPACLRPVHRVAMEIALAEVLVQFLLKAFQPRSCRDVLAGVLQAIHEVFVWRLARCVADRTHKGVNVPAGILYPQRTMKDFLVGGREAKGGFQNAPQLGIERGIGEQSGGRTLHDREQWAFHLSAPNVVVRHRPFTRPEDVFRGHGVVVASIPPKRGGGLRAIGLDQWFEPFEQVRREGFRQRSPAVAIAKKDEEVGFGCALLATRQLPQANPDRPVVASCLLTDSPSQINRLESQPLGKAKLLEPRKDLALQRISFGLEVAEG
jgi:hypothetical protein